MTKLNEPARERQLILPGFEPDDLKPAAGDKGPAGEQRMPNVEGGTLSATHKVGERTFYVFRSQGQPGLFHGADWLGDFRVFDAEKPDKEVMALTFLKPSNMDDSALKSIDRREYPGRDSAVMVAVSVDGEAKSLPGVGLMLEQVISSSVQQMGAKAKAAYARFQLDGYVLDREDTEISDLLRSSGFSELRKERDALYLAYRQGPTKPR